MLRTMGGRRIESNTHSIWRRGVAAQLSLRREGVSAGRARAHVPLPPPLLLLLLCVSSLPRPSSAAASVSLTTVQSAQQLWEQTALDAAEATIAAIAKETRGGAPRRLSLRGVPLDTLRVFAGRQHLIALELDKVQYKLSFNTDADGGGLDADGDAGGGGGGAHDAATRGGGNAIGAGRTRHAPLAAKALPAAADGGAAAAASSSRSSNSDGGGSAVAPVTPPAQTPAAAASVAAAPTDPFSWVRQRIQLPEITLAGPLEVSFPRPTPLTLLLPRAVEAPPARRVLLAPGAAVTLRGLRGVGLGRPVELPNLPPSYLADVLAQAQLGELGAGGGGLMGAPGVQYLAGELYRAATNASLAAAWRRGRALISLEVEPALGGSGVGGTGSVSVVSAVVPPAREPQRMRARPLADGSGVEIVPRDGAGAGGRGQDAASAAADAAAAQPPPFSWPLPLAGPKAWLPYESLLRGVLSAHPFANLRGALTRGAELRLTRSSLHGVKMLSFDMELIAGDLPEGADKPGASAGPGASPSLRAGELALRLLRGLDADRVLEGARDALEVWQAVVEVRERPDGGGVEYVPLSVKRRHDYHSTLTLSPSGLADALGRGNGSEVYSLTFEQV